MLRRIVRATVPEALRARVAQARRARRDTGLRLARRAGAPPADFPHLLTKIAQEIKGGVFLEGKLANIALGVAALDGVVIAPGEILSFWALVGRPSVAAGFRTGRSIRGGVAGGDIGGGLCQVSGITYEAGLRAGLCVAERHPHSRDLYTEEERFTPLGLDATVVWPYRDLRLLNAHPVPLCFRVAVCDRALVASVHAPVVLPPVAIEIERTDLEGRRHVRVLRRTGQAGPELVSDDVYPVLPGA